MAAPQTKLKITGIGILSRFYIMHYRNKDVGIDIRGILEKDRPVDLKTGMEITPNLKIRFANKEDSDILAPFNPSLNSIIHCSLNQYVLESTFEVEDNPETSAETQRHISHVINSTVQALRLFKTGYVDANTILWISERNTDKQTSLFSEQHSSNSLSEYSLATHEITELSDLVAKTLKIDLEKRKSLRIALDRFNRAYYEEENEDKLIDYIIAFEALFSSGKRRRSQHAVIPVACAMLLGKSEEERNKITSLLDLAYKTRNHIVHGSDCHEILKNSDYELEELVTDVEDALRASLRKLV
jgi:hypothetical protein